MQTSARQAISEMKTRLRLVTLLATAMMAQRPFSALASDDAPPSSQKRGTIVYRLSRRAYPKTITDEAAYAKWIDKQIAALDRRVASARDPSTRVHLLLGLANLRLARQAEPAATRRLLGDESAGTRKRLADVAAAAQAEIKRAVNLLGDLDKSPPPHKAAAKQRSRWKQAADELCVLAAGVAAIARESDASACVARLEPLTKSKRPELASAARLLRVVLMRQSGQAEKALAQIESALSPPKQLPHDFFLRLLRCRLLADRGSYAMATALALQMDVQSEGWFDKSQLPDARRAIGLLRIDLAERWADRLQRDKLTEHAARRRAIAERIGKELFGGKDKTVYRLIRVVPILVEPPPPPPKPSTARSVRRRQTTTRTARSQPVTTSTSTPASQKR